MPSFTGCVVLSRDSRRERLVVRLEFWGRIQKAWGLGEQWEAGDLLRQGVIKNEF